MFTDGFSAWGSPQHDGKRKQRRSARAWSRAWAAAVALLSANCSDEPFDGVTYAEEIRPIFARRCTTCHRPGGPSGVDIRDPFSSEPPPNAGIARAMTQWKVRNPSLDIPSYNVKAGDPEDSFVMYKVSDPALRMLPEDPDGPFGPEYPPAGQPMPLQVPPLDAGEVALLEDWVAAGAVNGAFMDRDRQPRDFEDDIRPIFGVEDQLNQENGVCRSTQGSCARCIYCHYEGTPNPPNLSDPFGPDGIVGVSSILRPDMQRVVPGNPEQSLLIHKVRPGTSAEYGARMPYSFAPLSQEEVSLVRQWIEDGARP